MMADPGPGPDLDPGPNLLLKRVEVRGSIVDVEIRDGLIHRIGSNLSASPDTRVADGGDGALIPGLHDHHTHLAALAAARDSVSVGPPVVTSASGLTQVLRSHDRTLERGQWLRATGYHESVAGDLDREALDRIVRDRPVRIQHRTGVRWTLNSAALLVVGADEATHPGVQRDSSGRPTGRLDRADDWLRAAIGGSTFPDLAAVGRTLGECGVTGVTDCTPYSTPDAPEAIAGAARRGQLPQRVVLTGHVDLLDAPLIDGVELGPVKVILEEADLPEFDHLTDTITRAHSAGRPVAIHLVTAAATAFALAAWRASGSRPGDRIEHGSVITTQMAELIAQLGLTVVTQPGFIAERGDQYLAEVDRGDIENLYRCASLQRLGIAVMGSTDAPYTQADPWAGIRAAMQRCTPAGAVIGKAESLSGSAALGLFTCDPLRPGAQQVELAAGSPADLCLLHLPLRDALGDPGAENVRATLRRGTLIGGNLD
jgi:predicted amidohydrolase YtcJ